MFKFISVTITSMSFFLISTTLSTAFSLTTFPQPIRSQDIGKIEVNQKGSKTSEMIRNQDLKQYLEKYRKAGETSLDVISCQRPETDIRQILKALKKFKRFPFRFRF